MKIVPNQATKPLNLTGESDELGNSHCGFNGISNDMFVKTFFK